MTYVIPGLQWIAGLYGSSSLLSKAFNLAELWGWRERGSNPTRGI